MIRNSNHELMRIISIFFIVLWHCILAGNLTNTSNPNTSMIYTLIQLIIIIHVNSYVLVSGYYQSKSTFKQSKLWKIINSAWFYRVVIMLSFSLIGIISIGKVQILKDLVPIGIDNYWFIKTYIILYCLSPFLNKLINSLDKKAYQKMLLLGFFIFCIVPNITGGEFFANTGYTLYSFIYLYLIGAYLRIYPLDKNHFFKIFSKKLFRIIMIAIFFGCAFLNNILYYYGNQLSEVNGLFDLFSNYIVSSYLNYSNPIVVIQSIAYFSFFTTLDFKSKFINYCSTLMLGVYFIHESNYVRDNLYQWLGIVNGPKESLSFIPYVFLIAIAIFIVCAIIEAVRQKVFSFIYKRKFTTKIREKYYNYLNQIHLTNK